MNPQDQVRAAAQRIADTWMPLATENANTRLREYIQEEFAPLVDRIAALEQAIASNQQSYTESTGRLIKQRDVLQSELAQSHDALDEAGVLQGGALTTRIGLLIRDRDLPFCGEELDDD